MRGTPQQIIDKYNQLARDAQLSNDPVATENFQQHAEHYLRLLAEAQREQEARREQQEQQQQQNRERREQQQADRAGQGDAPNADGAADVVDAREGGDAGADSGLVDTPEAGQQPKRRSQSRGRSKKVDMGDQPQPDMADVAAPQDGDTAGTAAE